MALEFIAGGVNRFPELFRKWSAAEPGYGLGDAQLWDVLIRLVECERPLLRLEGSKSDNSPLTKGVKAAGLGGCRGELTLAFTLTETGRAILDGQRDLWEMEPQEFWLGGVRLAPPNPRWRWDEQRQVLAG